MSHSFQLPQSGEQGLLLQNGVRKIRHSGNSASTLQVVIYGFPCLVCHALRLDAVQCGSG